jgi:phosphoribosyl-ATP pyrophosphohydrolase/phosphoribosyl-AMP cyclohydrolase
MRYTELDLEKVKFDERGLVPTVVQDAATGEVLMTAWASRDALRETARTGKMTFWSRSRGELWRKGETSGNEMAVRELRADCDGDTLLALVDPAGSACHTGERSCFHRTIWGEMDSSSADFAGRLYKYLLKRKGADPHKSYTARLLSEGRVRAAQKVGEEAVETALAAVAQGEGELKYEAADLIYHLLVLLISADISLEDVLSELKSRHKA